MVGRLVHRHFGMSTAEGGFTFLAVCMEEERAFTLMVRHKIQYDPGISAASYQTDFGITPKISYEWRKSDICF